MSSRAVSSFRPECGNSEPPLDFGSAGNTYSRFGDPRLSTYYLSVRKIF